ncbi:SAM-dependent methyltransferase [uncultured Cetobacterium sp.]|uniref:TRM11 family SAM-dependent methyltransferase n=1 Tax=uncultured Cetobacterium sp. TaxID=527638 RepID=UPI002609532C|nr:SAM-dependent methyltransferase [uncultured Cetobacterium sp.]
MKEKTEFIYTINYPREEKNLCLMEMRALFNIDLNEKTILSNVKIDPVFSPFIKSRLEILYSADNFEDILKAIISSEMESIDYKVEYIKEEDENISYEERLDKIKQVGLSILGTFSMKNPKNIFGVSNYKGKWYFGICVKGDTVWPDRIKKPYSYSNSLEVRLARTLISLAVEADRTKKLVDPCCGVGTVIIEALSMGLDVTGYEINRSIAKNANTNLGYYGYDKIVVNDDMHNIEEKFDSAILDIPYGLFSHITKDEQFGLIKKIRQISKRLIMVSFEDLEEMIIKSNFKILDSCILSKGSFQRYIYICS